MAQIQMQIAEVLIFTYRKATVALKSQPYPLNLAPAAAALAEGLAQIERLRQLEVK